MTFVEEHRKIWVCTECRGALTEKTLRSIKRTNMLEKCPQCGADASDTPIEAYPDSEESAGLVGRIIERFK